MQNCGMTKTKPVQAEAVKRAPGRQPVDPDLKTQVRAIRLDDADWVLYRTIGGNKWLRDRLARERRRLARMAQRE